MGVVEKVKINPNVALIHQNVCRIYHISHADSIGRGPLVTGELSILQSMCLVSLLRDTSFCLGEHCSMRRYDVTQGRYDAASGALM